MGAGKKCPNAQGAAANECAYRCAAFSPAEEQKAPYAHGPGLLRTSMLNYESDTCVVVDLPRICTFDSGFSWFQKP